MIYINDSIIFLLSLDIWIHSFIISFFLCIPFTFSLYEKYFKNKQISHYEAWYLYIRILTFCVLFNIYRLYSENCNPKCLYILGNLEFSSCCREMWFV